MTLIPRILFLSFLLTIFSCGDSANKEQKSDKKLSKEEQMIESITNAIVDSPKNARLYYERGKLYWAMAENERALNDFYKMTSFDSTNADYYEVLADFFVENGNVDRGIKSLDFAVKYNPNETRYYMKQGKYSFILKKYQNAINYLNNALKRDDQNAEAYLYKGLVYSESNNIPKAISYLQTAIEQDPSWDQPYEILGNIYADKKDDKAIKYYENAYKVNPRNETAIIQKAQYYNLKNQKDKAIETYKEFIQSQPQNATALYNLSILNFEKGDYEGTMKSIDILTQIDPANAKAYYIKGMTYLQLNQKDIAKKSFEISYSLDTTMVEAKEEIYKL